MTHNPNLPTSLKWHSTKAGLYPEDYEAASFTTVIRQLGDSTNMRIMRTAYVLCKDNDGEYYVAYREYDPVVGAWYWGSADYWSKVCKEHKKLSPCCWSFLP